MTESAAGAERHVLEHDRKPRLLFLCQNLPYPPDGGAMIRSFHTLRLLSREFRVTAVLFYRQALKPSPADVRAAIEGLEGLAEVHVFPMPQDGNFPRMAADHLKSLVTNRVYTRWAYDSRAARRCVKELVRSQDFDMVHLDSLDLAAFLPDLPAVPHVCAHHNVESQLLRRRAEAESGWRRAYLRHQAGLMEREERRLCPGFALNLVVSPEDQEVLSGIASEGRFLVVPNGVDTTAFQPAPGDAPREGIVFVGGYTWFPNRDGMEYFASAILPHIREARPDVPVFWVGRAGPEVEERFAGHGVEVTGYVEDIRPRVHRAACFVVPIRVGGGTRLKILDAWALGKAVVSTSPGSEGLAVKQGKNMLVEDDPQAFARAVLRVLDSEALRERLEKEGRRTAVEKYDWDVVGRSMLSAYSDLLRGTVSEGPQSDR